MDRTILESNPHQVIEGIIACAYAVGAHKAIVYIRAEYPLAVRIVTAAIHQAQALGLVGTNILGSSFDLEIEVFQGSGAFVCGEETALISSIEGLRGMPIQRPPYPVKKGLWGNPTVINNVKTLASVPPILKNGADWYKQIGTENSPGTAIFSVVGDVTHPGLIEIPMGVTLRTLLSGFAAVAVIENPKTKNAARVSSANFANLDIIISLQAIHGGWFPFSCSGEDSLSI